jgi:undecaprenyl-diphosphatase
MKSEMKNGIKKQSHENCYNSPMFEAVMLGIVQGLTEFIPVSSSAHLIVLPWFFKWQGFVDTLAFDVALHFGTLLSLLFYFRNDWITLLKTAGRKDSLIWHICIATVPAVAAGLVFHKDVERLRSPLLIAFTLFFVAALMIIVEKKRAGGGSTSLYGISRMDAVMIGIAQALALVPGVSRSGITIVAGLMRGIKRQDSARFSFLLSTPVVLGASVFEARKLVMSNEVELDLFITGVIASAAAGYFAIKYLLRFLQNHSLVPFACYRFFLAFVIILTIWI